jgi:hypothetical protein
MQQTNTETHLTLSLLLGLNHGLCVLLHLKVSGRGAIGLLLLNGPLLHNLRIEGGSVNLVTEAGGEGGRE